MPTVISFIVVLLFTQAPIDFADHLYDSGDYARAALEYERIGMTYLPDSLLSAYSLLKAGQALLQNGQPERAVRVYRFGESNLAFQSDQFRYGLLRACFDRDDFTKVDSIAETLAETDFNWHSSVYRSFSLAFMGDTAQAIGRLRRLAPNGPRDSAVALIAAPIKHRSLFTSAALSTILPGAGQAYCGRWGDAWQSFSITALMAGAGIYYLAFSADTSTGNTIKGVVFCSLGGLFWLGNIYGAVNAALDYNEYQERKKAEQLRNLLEEFDLAPEIKRP
jgi:TM2 domain-containing membrane protein YozV